MKTRKNIEDVAIGELEKPFIEDCYTWMPGTAGNVNTKALGRINTLTWLLCIAQERRGVHNSPHRIAQIYTKRFFLSADNQYCLSVYIRVTCGEYES
ncbi:hypothetical protein ACIXCC_02805 [Bacteroides fragilis]